MGSTRLHIHLQPRAAHDRIVGRHGEAWKVQVHAPPIDGAANAALLALLARTLHIPCRQLRLVHGATSRDKLVEIDGLSGPECELHLMAAHRVDKKKRGD